MTISVAQPRSPESGQLGWRTMKVKHLSTKIGSGKTPKGGNQVYVESGVLFLRSQNIYDDGLRLDDVAYIDGNTDTEMYQTRVQPGDVLLNITGASIGRTCVVPCDLPPANVNQHVCIIRPKVGVDPIFLGYALKSAAVKDQIRSFENGSSREGLNYSQLGNLLVSTPGSKERQRAITDFLDRKTAAIDAVIAKKQRMIELLTERIRGRISKVVLIGLDDRTHTRDSTIAWVGQTAAHWSVCRAKYLLSQSALPPRDADGVVTAFRDGQVTLRANRRTEGFTFAVLETGYQGVRKGQLVVHSMDAFAGAIGISDSDGKCTPEYIVCDARRPDVHLPYYGLLLREMARRRYIEVSCLAVRERAPRIRFSTLGEMLLLVPPLAEQVRIVGCLRREADVANRATALLSAQVERLREYRHVLISSAVAGACHIA